MKNVRFTVEKLKTDFQCFYPRGSKEKIQGTYFEICQTYFKISQTYFLPPENYIEKCLENADKKLRSSPVCAANVLKCRLQGTKMLPFQNKILMCAVIPG